MLRVVVLPALLLILVGLLNPVTSADGQNPEPLPVFDEEQDASQIAPKEETEDIDTEMTERRACQTDADCTAKASHCRNSTCVQCLNYGHCPTGWVCFTQTGTCGHCGK